MIVVRRPDADFMAAFMFFCESVSSNKKKEKRKKIFAATPINKVSRFEHETSL